MHIMVVFALNFKAPANTSGRSSPAIFVEIIKFAPVTGTASRRGARWINVEKEKSSSNWVKIAFAFLHLQDNKQHYYGGKCETEEWLI